MISETLQAIIDSSDIGEWSVRLTRSDFNWMVEQIENAYEHTHDESCEYGDKCDDK